MMSSSKQKILVVDDEESLCEIIQFNLEVEGYTVDTAYSAEEALQLDLPSYSLILLDVMMGCLGLHAYYANNPRQPISPSFSVRPETAKTTL